MGTCPRSRTRKRWWALFKSNTQNGTLHKITPSSWYPQQQPLFTLPESKTKRAGAAKKTTLELFLAKTHCSHPGLLETALVGFPFNAKSGSESHLVKYPPRAQENKIRPRLPRQVSTIRESIPLQFTMGRQPSKNGAREHLAKCTRDGRFWIWALGFSLLLGYRSGSSAWGGAVAGSDLKCRLDGGQSGPFTGAKAHVS